MLTYSKRKDFPLYRLEDHRFGLVNGNDDLYNKLSTKKNLLKAFIFCIAFFIFIFSVVISSAQGANKFTSSVPFNASLGATSIQLNINRNFLEKNEAVFTQNNPSLLPLRETNTLFNSTNVGGGSETGRPGVTIPTLEINMYTLNMSGVEYLADGLLINFNNIYSAGVDNYDVRKIMNVYDNIAVKNGIYFLVVERRPNLTETDIVKLNISGMRLAQYRLEIDPSVLEGQGVEAVFKDKFLQTETPMSMKEVTNINFTCTSDAASRAADRFTIVCRAISTTNFTTIAATRNLDRSITVNWGTQNETRVIDYTLEHSVNGVNFSAIGTEAPVANNGTNPTYNRKDVNSCNNKNWYRVRVNNMGGSVKYSAIAMVNDCVETLIADEPKINIYPNPVVGGKINLNFKDQSAGNYSVFICNNLGQFLQKVTVKINGSNKVESINTGVVKPGSYLLSVINEKGKVTSIPFITK